MYGSCHRSAGIVSRYASAAVFTMEKIRSRSSSLQMRITINHSSLAPETTRLEPPLLNKKCTKRRRGVNVLIPLQRRLTQNESRVDSCLQSITLQSTKAMHHLHTGPLQGRWIEW